MHSKPPKRSAALLGHAGGARAGIIGAVWRAVELQVQRTLWEKHQELQSKQKLNSHTCLQSRVLILPAFIYCAGGIAQFSTDVSCFISLRLY